MDHPSLTPTRVGEVPTETYGQAHIHWLASKAASGARELTVGITTIEVGGGSPLHRHPNCEEVLHVLTGEIEKVIEGVPSFRMKPGDTITVPRNLKHRAFTIGNLPATMMVVFSSPQRETIVETNAEEPGDR